MIIYPSTSIEQLRSLPGEDGYETEQATREGLTNMQAMDEAMAAVQMMW